MCFAHVTECYVYQTFITVTEMDHDNRIKVTNVMVHDKSDTAVVSITVAVIACWYPLDCQSLFNFVCSEWDSKWLNSTCILHVLTILFHTTFFVSASGTLVLTFVFLQEFRKTEDWKTNLAATLCSDYTIYRFIIYHRNKPVEKRMMERKKLRKVPPKRPPPPPPHLGMHAYT